MFSIAVIVSIIILRKVGNAVPCYINLNRLIYLCTRRRMDMTLWDQIGGAARLSREQQTEFNINSLWVKESSTVSARQTHRHKIYVIRVPWWHRKRRPPQWGPIPRKHETLSRCWFNAGPPSQTVVQQWVNIGSTPRVYWEIVVISATTPAQHVEHFNLRDFDGNIDANMLCSIYFREGDLI